MREIKYRAIDKKTGDFVYGFLSYADFAFIIVEPIDIPPTMSEPGGDHITLWHQIKSETIGQFTGLKDKKGKEIYCGDFIEDEGGKDYLVDFRYGSFMAIHRPSCRAEIEGEPISDYLYDFSTTTHHEIIGNENENPELLK